MPERRIFVSCGQLTELERKLGRDLTATIEAHPGMTAFFAGEVHSAAGLNAEIFQEGTPRPIMVYQQRGIRLEGLMSAAIVNPVPFNADDEVIAGVEAWLR